MKKMMLGVLALSSVASLASGYVRTSSEAKVNNTSLAEDKIKTPGYEVKPNIELGITFGENKDGFIFVGGQLSLSKELKNGQQEALKTNKNFYLGSRIDTNVAENTNLKLTFLYDKQEKDKDKKFIERLKEQGKWDNKLKTDDDKDAFRYLSGYKLFDDKNTILISSVLNGKYDENIDYNLGFIYGSQDFLNNTFESFLKAKGKFESFDVEGNVTSTLGTYKIFKDTVDKYKLFKEDENATPGNLANGGRLAADLKVSSDRLVDGLTLSAKGNTVLGTVLPVKDGHMFKAGLETEAKYKLETAELKAKLNYNADVHNVPLGEKKVKENGEFKYTENEGSILHKPEIVLGVKYTGMNKLTLETEVSDTVFVKHSLASKIEKKDSSSTTVAVAATPGKGNEEIKRLEAIHNYLVVKNNLDYAVSESAKLGLTANYGLESAIIANRLKVGKDQAHSHRLVVGPNVKVDIKNDSLEAKSDTKLRYVFELNDGVKLKRKHGFILTNDTNVKYTLGSVKLEPSLFLLSANRLSLDADDIKEYLAGSNISYVEKNGKYISDGITFVAPKVKATYEMNKLSVSGEVSDDLTLIYAISGKELSNQKINAKIDIVNKLKTNLELGYKVTDEVKPVIGLGTEYTYTNAALVHNLTSNKLIDKLKDAVKNVDDVKKDPIVDQLVEEVKKIKDDDKLTTKHAFGFNPFVKVEAKLLDGKLTFEPKVEANVKYSLNILEPSNFEFKSIEGKASLKLEYKW